MKDATTTLHVELTTKVRSGWELNGYMDGMADRHDRIPFGRMSVRDTYLRGWRDGEQVRLMLAAREQPFEYNEKEMFPFAADQHRKTD